MKAVRVRGILSFLFTALILLTFAFPSSASPSHEAKLKIEDNTVFVIIPAPEKLISIDFSVELDAESVKLYSISFEGCDTEATATDISQLPDTIPSSMNFIYNYSLSDSSVSFSGYFIDSYTEDEDFILCRINLESAGEITENDSIKLSYHLNCELCSKSDSAVYSLYDGKPEVSANMSYHSGDADGDGNVSASDARTILRAAVGLETLSLRNIPYADADYDGIISASDARQALRSSVGLEKPVIHRFDISLEEDALCENGGNYTFICSITGKTFSMEITDGGHVLYSGDCYSAGRCIICGTDVQPASGHKYDDNGKCSVCNADKQVLEDVEARLIPILEEINTCDTLADEYLSGGKKSEFLGYTQKATRLIMDAADLCNNVDGMEEVHNHLIKAYKIRFNAFSQCMDDNGSIAVNTKNCETILTSVRLSNTHIDYACYITK